jgi:hypothetical protein
MPVAWSVQLCFELHCCYTVHALTACTFKCIVAAQQIEQGHHSATNITSSGPAQVLRGLLPVTVASGTVCIALGPQILCSGEPNAEMQLDWAAEQVGAAFGCWHY